MRHRLRRVVVILAATPVLLAGCGTGSSSTPQTTHLMPDDTVMAGSEMPGMDSSDPMTAEHGHGAAGPSETASMICGNEIRGAVRRNLDLANTPVGLHAWHQRLYNCTYEVEAGDLRLSVKDLDRPGPGRAYYNRLRHRLAGAADIRGLASFGFPAFETPQGDVVFIKDHKTLWVDATDLKTADLPADMTRQDVAYGVASAVIGCWTE